MPAYRLTDTRNIPDESRFKSHGSRPFVPILLIAAIGVLLLIGTSSQAANIQTLVAACSLALAGLLVAGINSRQVPVLTSAISLRLGVLMPLSLAVVGLLGTSAWLFFEPKSLLARVPEDFLLIAAVLLGAGLIFFSLGYRLAPQIFVRLAQGLDASVTRGSSRGLSPGGVLLLLMVSLTGHAMRLATNSFGYATNDPLGASINFLPWLGGVLSALDLCAVALACWLVAVKRTRSSLALAFLAFSLCLLLALLQSGRAPVLELVIAALAGAALGAGQNITKKTALLGVLVLVCAFIVMTEISTSYRTVINSGSERLGPIAAASQFLNDPDRFDSSAEQSTLESALFRLGRVGDVAIIMSRTPSQVPYADTTSLLTAPVLGVIPRQIWRGKPIIDTSGEMTRFYYQAPNLASGTAMTPVGDLWRRGGLPIVALGMPFLGVLIRLVDDRVAQEHASPIGLFLPLLLLFPFASWETDFVGLVAGFPLKLVQYVLACRILAIVSLGNAHAFKSANGGGG